MSLGFALSVAVQVGSLLLLSLVGYTDDSWYTALPMVALALGLVLGLALLVSPTVRHRGIGVLAGTAASLVVFGIYLMVLAMALADT